MADTRKHRLQKERGENRLIKEPATRAKKSRTRPLDADIRKRLIARVFDSFVLFFFVGITTRGRDTREQRSQKDAEDNK